MKATYLLATAALAILSSSACAAAAESVGAKQDSASYKVVDGNKVDPVTLKGFRAWRAAACERCHGANAAGLVGPSLLEAMKRLSKEEFSKTVLDGRIEKGMPPHKTMRTVVDGIDGLYLYLKGRADGAIKAGRLEAIPSSPGTAEAAQGR